MDQTDLQAAFARHSRQGITEPFRQGAQLFGACFEVHEADNSASALAALYAHQTVHCLFTDVDLGTHMTGLDLAAAVGDEWPDIKVIVASGKRHLLPSQVLNGRFFAKPYNFDQIASTIRVMVVSEAVHLG